MKVMKQEKMCYLKQGHQCHMEEKLVDICSLFLVSLKVHIDHSKSLFIFLERNVGRKSLNEELNNQG